jgi:hypothetical protein
VGHPPMNAATESDVNTGRAVFHVPDNRSRVFDIGVPLPANAVVISNLDVGEGTTVPAGTRVIVIQAEIVDQQDVLLGFTYPGGQGVCTIEQVEIPTRTKSG